MQWYGFNFQWMFSWQPGQDPAPPDLKALDFLGKHGFNFARLACDYRFWTMDWDYLHPNMAVVDKFEAYLNACRERGIHMSLNMHRVPGYCINRPEIEKHNLWTDIEAQDGLTCQWETFAKRFKGVPPEALSFDLINEPPNIGQFGMTREVHQGVIRRVVAAIRAIDPDRPIVIDGLEGGHIAMPELADLDVIHSGRGYQPMPVSHQGATWWDGWKGHAAVYPGGDWWGHEWNREVLHEFYEPWRAVGAMGRPIHIGEFGCFNQTPNDVALRWFADLFSLWREYGWGWGMWGFEGAFGIVEHGRPGAKYEMIDGYKVDRELLELLKP
ncbi:MAG TPA: cellulase family glycosylhydrolase [Fimbriimonas sp.]|nr:cellulase family glycosylhydrolase [Fimbriimonas sp.]